MFTFISGSKTFCTNCGDEDIICVADSVEKIRDRKDNTDIFYFDTDTFRARLTFNSQGKTDWVYRELYNVGFAMLKEQGKIDGTMPEDIANYNWFDYKDKAIARCIEQCESYALNKRVRNRVNHDACLKHTYWIFANYFALINGNLEFTDEQLEIIQKCHDNELPRSYAEDMYNALLAMSPNASTTKQEEAQAKVTVTHTEILSYDELVNQKIRRKYSLSAELAILRQRDTKPEEFAEYNAYCEQCKEEARAELEKTEETLS